MYGAPQAIVGFAAMHDSQPKILVRNALALALDLLALARLEAGEEVIKVVVPIVVPVVLHAQTQHQVVSL